MFDLEDHTGKVHGRRYITLSLAIEAAKECALYTGQPWRVVWWAPGATVPAYAFSTDGAFPVLH